MPIKKQETFPGQPGYFDKNENRHRYCNNFHDEGFRCTRQIGHKGPHAGHIVRGSEVKYQNMETDPTKPERWELPQGTKTDINVQIATW